MMKFSPLRIIISSAKLQMKQSFSRSMFKFSIIVSPIFFGLLMGFIYTGRSPEDFVSYVMIGTATTTMWTSISFSSAGDIERERYMGALQQIFNAPQNFYHVMLGKILGNTLLGSFSMVSSFIYIHFIFNIPIKIENPFVFISVFLFALISYGMIAMMLSGLLAISRQTRMLMNCMDYPVFLLTGSVFPIEILPVPIQFFSYALSPTYAIKLLRYSVSGNFSTSSFLLTLVGLIFTTTIYFVLSILVYKFIDINAREKATLEVI